MFAARLLARNARLLPTSRSGVYTRASTSIVLHSRSFSVQNPTSDGEQPINQDKVEVEQDPPPPPPPPPEPDVIFTQREAPVSSLSPYLLGLAAVGLGSLTYGLYSFYAMMTLWPQEVRQDLRSGLRAKRKGDFEIAAQYLTRAWGTARTLPIEIFGDEPLLKISGIGIALAGVYEECKQLDRAYKTYEDTLWYLRTAYLDLPLTSIDKDPNLGIETLKVLTVPEKMRTVAIAYKLGELAETLHKPDTEQEKWLVWSVEAILRTVLSGPPLASAEVAQSVTPKKTDAKSNGNGTNVKVLVEQLGLPQWSISHDLSAPFEALGTFYAKHNNISFALPLYLQAVSILVPPAPLVSSPEDKCRGAQIMGNIAELIMRNQTPNKISSDVLAQAESWARKGLDIATTARKFAPGTLDVCEEAYAVLLYNVAMVKEFSGDPSRARALLNESLQHSKSIGMKDGIVHAESALKEIDAVNNGSISAIKPRMAGEVSTAANDLE